MPRGLVTGIVSYVRGLYFWKLYNLGQRNEVAADAVYTCFKEACQDYLSEKVLKMSNFVCQILAFIALFCLQVDIQPRIGPVLPEESEEVISPENVKRAEDALIRMRETETWKERTVWSEMLYYIAHGELFLCYGGTPNLRQALRSFQKGLTMAEEHKFPLYKQHAEKKISYINDVLND